MIKLSSLVLGELRSAPNNTPPNSGSRIPVNIVLEIISAVFFVLIELSIN